MANGGATVLTCFDLFIVLQFFCITECGDCVVRRAELKISSRLVIFVGYVQTDLKKFEDETWSFQLIKAS